MTEHPEPKQFATEEGPAPVVWPQRIRLRGGMVARYLGKCPITGRHRVLDTSRGIALGDGHKGTVWLLDDYGRARGDLTPSEVDFAGEAA